jgi:hypothetical protein
MYVGGKLGDDPFQLGLKREDKVRYSHRRHAGNNY